MNKENKKQNMPEHLNKGQDSSNKNKEIYRSYERGVKEKITKIQIENLKEQAKKK